MLAVVLAHRAPGPLGQVRTLHPGSSRRHLGLSAWPARSFADPATAGRHSSDGEALIDITFGPQVCGQVAAGGDREWLVTNGRGG